MSVALCWVCLTCCCLVYSACHCFMWIILAAFTSALLFCTSKSLAFNASSAERLMVCVSVMRGKGGDSVIKPKEF